MRRLLALMPLLSAAPVIAAAPPLPLPPLPQPTAQELPLLRLPQRGAGSAVRINGLRQQARWRLEAGELWLPLEVLEGQLGMNRSQGRGRSGAGVVRTTPGAAARAPAQPRRRSGSAALPLLEALGVQLAVRGEELQLNLPPTNLRGIRSRDLGAGAQRVVLDLEGPGLVRSGDGRLLVSAQSNADQQRQLEGLGLAPARRDRGCRCGRRASC